MELQTFDIRSQAFFQNPYPTLAAMREAGPLIRTKLPLIGKIWLATTHESVTTVLREKHRFVRDPRLAGQSGMAGLRWWMPRSLLVLAKNMLGADGQEHRRLRGLVEQAFMRQSVEGMRPQMESLADRFLDRLAREAQQNQGEADLMKHFARPFPLAVICELLGLPEEDHPRFTQWAGGLTRASTAWGMVKAMSGIKKLLKYLQGQFDQCRRQPRPGMISALVNAEHEGERLTEEELLSMSFLLLLAGHETTVYLISDGVLALLQHDDQRRKLMADWSLAEVAVDEMLRYMSPVQFTKPRYAVEDMELFGQRLKRGEFVMGMLASANADPAVFDQPEQFRIDREPNPHLTFGTGPHVCLGLKLARAEGAIATQRLFTRYPRLGLAIPEQELDWRSRLGLRSLKELPVRLNEGSRS